MEDINKHRNFEAGQSVYTYKCEVCGISEDLYYYMEDERPKEYQCPNCGTENSMYRIFNNKNIIVPYFWNNEQPFDFSKKPSKKKKYF